ncbi:MAG: DUF418 domain-containing protein [Erythrobacter sp.]|nr:DUF418 domain-containing protein [Erythrobacter sp.]
MQAEADFDEYAVEPSGEPIEPAQAGERIACLDFIRGFAVLGILAANIVAFGQPFGAYMWPQGFLSAHGAADEWLWVAQFLLIDGKMRGLFSLLFGAGMALFMDKAWARGATRWLQARRLFWLLLFGLAHFYLIWRGDILVLYSLAGFLALPFLRWKARNLLVLGVIGYVMGGLMMFMAMGLPHLVADTDFGSGPAMAETRATLDEAQAEELADDVAEAEILTQGNWFDFVRHNATVHASSPLTGSLLFLFETLPLVLIGMALYRLGLFDGRFARRKQLFWGWAGILAGTALCVPLALYVKASGFTYWGTIAAFIPYSHHARLLVVMGLAAVLAVYGATAQGWLAERLSAAGRMAFSNYLGTSLLMMFIFHPWAGGLWGELTRPELYLVVALGWAVMLMWSKPWLARYRYGPLEWLWRCLTYWQLFPLRR